jgi:hypothetical protein
MLESIVLVYAAALAGITFQHSGVFHSSHTVTSITDRTPGAA